MKFGPAKTTDALGAILAHSIGLANGRLRKGKVLGDADIERLLNEGITEVTVARLEAGDVDEDSAAKRLAAAILRGSEGLTATTPTTGRVNLLSEVIGIAEINAEAIGRINAIDPMITVATVPPWQRLDAGGMAATVKIISYGVAEAAMIAAERAAEGALTLRPVKCRNAVLIQTIVPGDDGEKGHEAIFARLDRLGLSHGPKIVVPHEEVALAEALTGAGADLILILTGSATSDIRDVAPAALQRAGGRVNHFGMPVDPGNLLFTGQLGNAEVIGLPGCARSIALNGTDWVLERLACGLKIGRDEITAMGVGGLLKEIPARGRLRRA